MNVVEMPSPTSVHLRKYGTLPRTITTAERNGELRKLDSLLNTNQLRFDGWSHVRACVELQVKVIQNPGMDLRPYDLDKDEGGSALTDDMLHRALNAQEWIDGHGGPAPSEEWRGQLTELVAALGEA